MIAGARRLPVQHLWVRAPWHRGGWLSTAFSRLREARPAEPLRVLVTTDGVIAETSPAGRALWARFRTGLPRPPVTTVDVV
jgi:hypothetical protein